MSLSEDLSTNTWVNNCIKQSFSWQLNTILVTFYSILFETLVRKTPKYDHVPSQLNPTHTHIPTTVKFIFM